MGLALSGFLLAVLSVGLMAIALLNPGHSESQNMISMIILGTTAILVMLYTILCSLERIRKKLEEK